MRSPARAGNGGRAASRGLFSFRMTHEKGMSRKPSLVFGFPDRVTGPSVAVMVAEDFRDKAVSRDESRFALQ